MPKEREGFREQLARLDERYPGREALTLMEVGEMIDVQPKTLAKTPGFPLTRYGDTRQGKRGTYRVSKTALARWLACE